LNLWKSEKNGFKAFAFSNFSLYRYAAVESVTKLLNFLLRGSRGGGEGSGGGGDPSKVLSELGPLLPAVATEVLPELLKRLNSRLTARAIRDVFAEIEPSSVSPVPTSR
jgi:hypothetical protein